MQLDQITLLQERVNKVISLTKKLKEENEGLKLQLAETRERLKELETSDMVSRFDIEEKQKTLSSVIDLLDGMLEESHDYDLPSDSDKALRYLAGDQPE